jgi:hypothetical protein
MGHRNYLTILVAFSLYSVACVQMGTLMYAACSGYYVRAWYALMLRSRYRAYAMKERCKRTAPPLSHGAPEHPPLVSSVIPQHIPKISLVSSPRIEMSSFVVQPKEHMLRWPLKPGTFWLSSGFGPRLRDDNSSGFHYGIDLAAAKGTPIFASRRGVVKRAGYVKGYGNMIHLKHDDARFQTRYAHLDTIRVKRGDRVTPGKIIGTVGDTGYIRKAGKDGSHLHFEVYYQGKRVNPMQFLPKLVC